MFIKKKSSKKFAEETCKEKGLYVKAVRFDQHCYIYLFCSGVVPDSESQKNRFSSTRIHGRYIRSPLRSDWVVRRKDSSLNYENNIFFRRKKDGSYLHSDYPHDLDKKQKLNYSPKQPTTLITPEIIPECFRYNDIDDKNIINNNNFFN